MQLKLLTELEQGLNKMKFANNHPWKFSNPGMAFTAGLMQASSTIVVTLMNFYTILALNEVIEIIMNFLALEVIAEIDNIVYSYHSSHDEYILHDDYSKRFESLF